MNRVQPLLAVPPVKGSQLGEDGGSRVLLTGVAAGHSVPL